MVQVMAAHHHGNALARQQAELLIQRRLLGDVQTAHRLIQQQQTTVWVCRRMDLQDHRRKPHALPLPARKLVDVARKLISQPKRPGEVIEK
ncbi:hypothetical protein D3C71_1948470 [compost metagenome]